MEDGFAGKQISMTFGSMIPLLGPLVGIGGLVLLVLWMVKIHELKNKIIADLRQSTGA